MHLLGTRSQIVYHVNNIRCDTGLLHVPRAPVNYLRYARECRGSRNHATYVTVPNAKGGGGRLAMQ